MPDDAPRAVRPAAPNLRNRAGARWRLDSADAHRALTWPALLGVVAGTSLAVLGLPTADLHGPLHYVGLMDPLCGATRGVRLAFLGDLSGAWRSNPQSTTLIAERLWAAAVSGAAGLC